MANPVSCCLVTASSRDHVVTWNGTQVAAPESLDIDIKESPLNQKTSLDELLDLMDPR